MSVPFRVKSRYEIQDVLGQGGMGVVYRAFDTRLKRLVALKTIRDLPDPIALELFQKECDILAQLSHPNIVEIFDLGEFDDEGSKKPYFVMPLLPGVTMDQLIHQTSVRLTVPRALDMIAQACRGLQAAHERGLVHRDLKPSNLFILEDDSVKIIDFGVAHIAQSRTTVGRKGTLHYMAPEQIEAGEVSAASDQFALAVVTFQALTGRRPFEGASEREVMRAILRSVPPPASQINPEVNVPVSQVIRKSLSKTPAQRFTNVREFASTLQKALHNEPIPFFDSSRVGPRVDRARRAYEEGDPAFAVDLLRGLEDEGHLDPDITALREEIEDSQHRQTLQKVLFSARNCFREEEFGLAQQKVDELLRLEPDHPDAIALKADIETKRNEQKSAEWYRLAQRHLDVRDFGHAREALQNLLQQQPDDARARQLLALVDEREQQYQRLQTEQRDLYESAVRSWQGGDLGAALQKLERVIELGTSGSQSRGDSTYQDLYNKVRSAYDQLQAGYEESRRLLAEGDHNAALAISDDFLGKYPTHSLFQVLRLDIRESYRQRLSTEIAEINRQLSEEPDLTRRMALLENAIARYPEEQHFLQMRRALQERRELIDAIIAKARTCEEQGQFVEAIGQWEILRSIDSQHEGAPLEIVRLQRRREKQARSEAKLKWIDRIDQDLEARQLETAEQHLAQAEAEFPGDVELASMRLLVNQMAQRQEDARRLVIEARELASNGRIPDAIALLWQAADRNSADTQIRRTLAELLVSEGEWQAQLDLEAAEQLARQALDLEPNLAAARNLLLLVQDGKKEQAIQASVAKARAFQADEKFPDALQVVDEALQKFGEDARLKQLQAVLQRSYTQSRERDLEEARRLEQAVQRTTDPGLKKPLTVRLKVLTERHPNEAPVTVQTTPARKERKRLSGEEEASPRRLHTVVEPGAGEPGKPLAPRPRLPFVWGKRMWIIAVATALVILAVLAFLFRPHAEPAASPLSAAPTTAVPVSHAVAVPIRTTPAGAGLRVDGIDRGAVSGPLRLNTGSHRLEFSLPGYQPLSRDIVVDNNTPPLTVTLLPVGSELKVRTDVPGLQLSLDGQKQGDPQNGELDLAHLSAGPHTLGASAKDGQVVFSLNTLPGNKALPQVHSNGKGLVGIVASGQEGHAFIVSSRVPAQVVIDAKAQALLGAGGLRLPDLQAGSHTIVINSLGQHWTFPLVVSQQPGLIASVHSGPGVGSLLITSNQDGAAVLVNRRLMRGTIQNGELQLPAVPSGDYLIEVKKDGFVSDPPQKATVSKGQVTKVHVDLRSSIAAISPMATLAITGAPANSEIWLDKVKVGVAQADGSFRKQAIAPGRHTIWLKRDGTDVGATTQDFSPDGSVQLTRGDFVAVDPASK